MYEGSGQESLCMRGQVKNSIILLTIDSQWLRLNHISQWLLLTTVCGCMVNHAMLVQFPDIRSSHYRAYRMFPKIVYEGSGQESLCVRGQAKNLCV